MESWQRHAPGLPPKVMFLSFPITLPTPTQI